ncbi:MAG: ABC transporter ATP-binding protein [Anaerolineae bacterium]|nr:ABC transporter ATP-binding protein [Anaerolineae bacterium]
MSYNAIEVHQLSKKFLIGARKNRPTLRDEMTGLARRVRPGGRQQAARADFWALQEVSFSIPQGQILGIIGHNGAGKSTLLKLLSRIYAPTSGRIRLRGRLGSLLEVGTGFHPELTGRANVALYGAILGLSNREIARKFDEIVTFAEIETFLDTPVKFYSSGMYMRLAFAVAAHLDAENLLVDEVLAVGDVAFQQKCLAKMGQIARDEGRTILLVSHNMQAIKRLCQRALLLEKGRLVMDDQAETVINHYLQQGVNAQRSATFAPDEARDMQFLRAELRDQVDHQGHKATFLRLTYQVRRPHPAVFIPVEVRNMEDALVLYTNSDFLPDKRHLAPGLHTVELDLCRHYLAPGTYRVSFAFWEPGHDPLDFPDVRFVFTVEAHENLRQAHGLPWPGLLYDPARWRSGEAPPRPI